jgi:hypothetical protein
MCSSDCASHDAVVSHTIQLLEPYMITRATIVLTTAALVSVSLGACGGDESTGPSGEANVRIVNVSSTTANLNAEAGGQSLASGVNFQNAAATCAQVDAGSHAINFTSGASSASVGSVTYDFQGGRNYTVVFYGANNAVVYPETFTAPNSGNMALRFINATATAGDIFLTTPSGSVSGSPTISNLAAGQVSGFNSQSAPGGTFGSYPSTNTRVQLFNVGVTTGAPRSDFTITTLPTNRVGTAILTTAHPVSGVTGLFVGSCAS